MTSVPGTTQKKKVNWFWPNITDLDTALEAAKGTMISGFLVAGITFAFVIIAMVQQGAATMITPWAIIDVVLFAAIGVGGKMHLRAAGVAGPVLFLLEKIYGFSQGAVPGGGGIVETIVVSSGRMWGASGDIWMATEFKQG